MPVAKLAAADPAISMNLPLVASYCSVTQLPIASAPTASAEPLGFTIALAPIALMLMVGVVLVLVAATFTCTISPSVYATTCGALTVTTRPFTAPESI